MNKKTITSAFILLLMLALGLPNPVYAGEAAPKLNQILGESSADVNYVVSDLDSRSAEYWQGVLDERERKEAERKWKEAERKRKEAERKRKEAERNKPSGPGISPEQREKDVDKDLANDKKNRPRRRTVKPREASNLPEKSVAMELKASAKRRKKGVRGPIGAQGVEVSTRNPKTVTTRLPKGEAQIRKIFFIGIPLHRLSSEQRNELLKNYASLLTEKEAQAFLNAIQRAEAGGPKVVVGGTWGKSRKCRQLISRLTLKGHPKEQGLPDKCFLRTKHGPSTAAGNYQIVYYINWRHLRRLLRLNDFSERNQAIAALELARSSRVKVPGSKVGDGLVALAKGDLKTAIRKGTDPWASSPYSRWRGKHPAPIMKYAQRELKKLQNAEYAKVQTNRFDIGKGDNSAE